MHQETSPRLEREVGRSVGEVAVIRKEVEAWLGVLGADGQAIDDVTLVVSELLSNAIRASPPEHSTSLAAWVEHGDVVLRVRNTVADQVDPGLDGPHPDDPLRETGRGLILVRALMEEVDLTHDRRTSSVLVVCRRRIAD